MACRTDQKAVDDIGKIVTESVKNTEVCEVLSYFVKWYLEKEEADKINRKISERRRKKENG
ncbi:MAG: hypothetical protein PUE72_08785 [Lachnospiraceae bacterium]|nr:hypothetical protein [Lachnospiraceae bacterium]